MAVILSSLDYSLHEGNFGTSTITFEQRKKQGLELDLSPKDGRKLNFDNYLLAPTSLYRVEASDAQVPEFSEPPSLMDLSAPSTTPQVLDTPAIIDSIVDVLPFGFNSPVTDLTSPDSEMTPAAVNALLGIEETERFQDLSHLLVDRPVPMLSCSPASPLTSPTDSMCSDITQSSSTSLLSAASTSSNTRFFALDFELLGSSSSTMKLEQPAGSYVDKRKRNNLASQRSRRTRKEKEKDMEGQLSSLYDENASLKNQVRNLEELVEQTKKIIMQAVARRS